MYPVWEGECQTVLVSEAGLGWAGLGWVGLGWVGLGLVGWLVGGWVGRLITLVEPPMNMANKLCWAQTLGPENAKGKISTNTGTSRGTKSSGLFFFAGTLTRLKRKSPTNFWGRQSLSQNPP